MFKSLFLPYDIYERHKKVGKLIGNNKNILDVGGQLNMLSQFCRAKKIVVANVAGSQETSDVIIKGDKLPFGSNSFQVVCAIDVLEHLPLAQRKSFIKDSLRVAQGKVVLSFPIGTPAHAKYEKEMQAILLKKDLDVTYLNEHIKYGLPTLNEITKITQGFRTRKYFSGNININKLLFKIFLFDPKIKYVRKIVYWEKLIFNLITNPIFYMTLSRKKYSPSVNRVYLVIENKK